MFAKPYPEVSRCGVGWRLGTWIAALTLCWCLIGCKNVNWRGQSPDRQEPVKKRNAKSETKTNYILDASQVNGLGNLQVEGIGLVVGLEGTGSNPAPSWQKDHLLEELKSREEIRNPSQLINSMDTSIVLVRAMIPPCARKGDPLDLEIILPPNSETTSLERGTLLPVRLKPMAYVGRKVREGKNLALGGGGIVVESLFDTRRDPAGLVRGWIPGGGRVSDDRELTLILNTAEFGDRIVSEISRVINNRFTTVDDTGKIGVANARTDRIIQLSVPENYRHNLGRYIEVVQSLAWGESVDARVNRMELLDQEIDDPAKAKLAAIRLEALGKDGMPALRRALVNPNLEVRFHAAQALAFQGQDDGVEILRATAETEPAFRWNALAALAALDGSKAGLALANLTNAESAEARYGAFRSLHTRSPNDPLVKGENLTGGFALHVIPSTAASMVHLTRTHRPEVVIFNDEQYFSPGLMWVEPGLTVRGEGDGGVSITVYGPDGAEQRMRCSHRVSDVIRTLGNSGCSYATIVNLAKTLKQQEQLESRLVVEALPRLGRYYDREKEALAAADSEREPGPETETATNRNVLSRLKSAFTGKAPKATPEDR